MGRRPALNLLDRLRRDRSRSVAAEERWLVVGLGNPEAQYGGTRHNLGADAVRRLAERLGATFRPHGYMNDCGGPVQQALAFYKVGHERLIVCHDDLDLELAALRLKRGGGHGGHNGLRSIDSRTGSRDYVRVRLGIGRPPGRQDPADYVLKRFSAKDREQVDVTVEQAGDAVLDVVSFGLEPAQNRHH